MRKLILVVLIICHTSLFAQNGFFVQPSVGMGVTNSTVSYFSNYFFNGYNTVVTRNAPKPIYKAALLVGHEYGHFIFKTGVSIFRSGINYELSDWNFAGTTDPYSSPEQAYSYYYYVSVPVSVGYRINIDKRLSLVPSLSYALGFVRSEYTVSTFHAEYYGLHSGPASGTNSFAALQLEVAYRLNSKFYLTAAPEAQYMVPTRFAKNTSYLANYTYSLNLGLRYYLGRGGK